MRTAAALLAAMVIVGLGLGTALGDGAPEPGLLSPGRLPGLLAHVRSAVGAGRLLDLIFGGAGGELGPAVLQPEVPDRLLAQIAARVAPGRIARPELSLSRQGWDIQVSVGRDFELFAAAVNGGNLRLTCRGPLHSAKAIGC